MLDNILGIIFFGFLVPIIIFILGIIVYRENKKKGKVLFLIATVYSIISFGLCGGFGF